MLAFLPLIVTVTLLTLPITEAQVIIRERVTITPRETLQPEKSVAGSSSPTLFYLAGTTTANTTVPGMQIIVGSVTTDVPLAPPGRNVAGLYIELWVDGSGGGVWPLKRIWNCEGVVHETNFPLPTVNLSSCGWVAVRYKVIRPANFFFCNPTDEPRFGFRLATAAVGGSGATFTIEDVAGVVPVSATVTVAATALQEFALAQVAVTPAKSELVCSETATVNVRALNGFGQQSTFCAGTTLTATASLEGVGPYAFVRKGDQEGSTIEFSMTGATSSFEVVLDTSRGVIPFGQQQVTLRVNVDGVEEDTVITLRCPYPPPGVTITVPAQDTTIVLTQSASGGQPEIILQETHSPASGKFEPTISWEPSQTINTADYFEQIEDSLVITVKARARNVAEMEAVDSVRITLKKNVLDHFLVTIVPDTIAQTDTATIFVQAKDAQDRDIELAGTTEIGFAIEEGSQLGQLTATSVSYGEAQSGNVRFVANGSTPSLKVMLRTASEQNTIQFDDRVLILGNVVIKAFLASDPAKNGRDTLVVRKKVKVVLQVGNQTLRPLGDSDNKDNPNFNKDGPDKRRKIIDFSRVKTSTAVVTVTDLENNPIENYPFTLRALVRPNSGGHDHSSNRPTGRFIKGTDTLTTVNDGAGSDGKRIYTYLSSGIGGVDSLFVKGLTEKDTA
ncbi:MAG: hypothetical protein ACRDGA_10895, partial [Bacteroidota bacterium]